MTDSQPARGSLNIAEMRAVAETALICEEYEVDDDTARDSDREFGRTFDPAVVLRLLDMVAKAGEVTDAMVRAASESCAKDDEGEFPPLCDLINYSGENKTRTVIRAALVAALQVKP